MTDGPLDALMASQKDSLCVTYQILCNFIYYYLCYLTRIKVD